MRQYIVAYHKCRRAATFPVISTDNRSGGSLQDNPIPLEKRTACPRSSVADPFHFDTAPDPLIRFVETRIRTQLWIRTKIENMPTFYNFFLLIPQK